MSEFDITFELFTLLLGLTMAEVLAGYARAYKLRSRIRHGRIALSDTDGNAAAQQIRIGWLVPLTAAVVLFHQATFWLFMYEMQGNVPLNLLSLVSVLVVIGWYYLIGAALWPDEPEAWPDFDEYYMAHRRFIWLGVIAIAILVEIGHAIFSKDRAIEAPRWMVDLVDWADVIGTLTLLAMPFVKSRRWAVGLLAVIVAHFAVTTIFAPWTFV